MLRTIKQIKIHDHTCLFFDHQIEFIHCLIPFVREGLINNEKVCIVIEEISKEEITKDLLRFLKKGLKPIQEIDKGSIVIEQFKNIYLQDDEFTIEKTLNKYVDILNKALEEGYKGLRVFAEVGRSAKEKIKTDRFLFWESEVDKRFHEINFLAVCAYNKKYFLEKEIAASKEIHPIEINVIGTRL